MAAIDGLGSGLDTTAIVKQLMDLERLPQARLSTQKTAATTRSATWSQLDTALAAVKTAADKLTTAKFISGAVTASSTDTAVVGVTASTGGLPGTYKVTVGNLATARQLTTAALPTAVGTGSLVLHEGLAAAGITGVQDLADPTAPGTPLAQTYKVAVSPDGGSLTVTSGTDVTTALITGGTVTVGALELTGTFTPGEVAEITVARVAGGNLTDLARTVNSATGVATATVVHDGAGNGTLVLSAKGTGSGSTLGVDSGQMPDLGGASGPRFTTTAGIDARVEVNDIPVTSRTNTLKDTVPGVTLTLQKSTVAAEPVTVTVAQDVAGPSAQVKGLVDAINGLFSQVTSATKYDVATKRAAPLTGNAAVRQIANDVYGAVGAATPTGSGTSLATLGISVQADGKYAFDEKELAASLTANPLATADLLARLSSKVAQYADGVRDGKTVNGKQVPGLIIAGKESAQSEAERLQKRIEEWDRRLALTQSRLTKQYTALDSALGGLKSQGTWLSGAIGSLGSWE